MKLIFIYGGCSYNVNLFLNQSFLILSSFLFLVLMLKVLSELFNFEYPKYFTFYASHSEYLVPCLLFYLNYF